MNDYYKILNINKNATSDEIKKAYRQAALFWHPDKNKSTNAHDKFVEISEAYSILITPEKRAVYDKLYDVYFMKKVDVSVYRQTSNEYKEYNIWVKEARAKAQKEAFKTFDKSLTETFHFIDKYGLLILILVMMVFLIFALSVTK